ncbi:menaquinone-specific isochorismate synthase [Frigoribacterium sp. PvP120]|uniref:isochorismate synthase n=1 Tax=unclassified Frigoribacterium TaxID=2627005 RepID=UPI001AE20F57|nr:isochorismate synthase [Frigoribacterium sp. PvP121]MBP1241144.1 menaquinone-specific isochorismate synthase [Frigoribacterium sp. PvP121]
MDLPSPRVPSLSVRTTQIDHISPLLDVVDRRSPLVFVRGGAGMAGIGEAVRLEFSGPSRMRDAAAAWRELAGRATVDDEVRVPGTGLIAFGSFAFDDESADTSVLIVPSIVIGRRDGVAWITRVDGAELPAGTPVGASVRLRLREGELSAAGYADAVARAVDAISAGDVSKVVLARDLVGQLPPEADLRLVAATLLTAYPDCYAFAVDGLIGASPETLVRSERGEVSARVLAGSAARGVDAVSDERAAHALATSPKDLDEHAFALRSLLLSLGPHATDVVTGEQPFTLKLPNLWHLASDVRGRLTDGSSSLDLIDSLHPTAAVAGTPTREALALIRELEPFDRGRYAGPVGWVGADGDGEWAIALRCAHVSPTGEVRAFAGAGVVAESVPEREVAETTMKFQPVVQAFSQ